MLFIYLISIIHIINLLVDTSLPFKYNLFAYIQIQNPTLANSTDKHYYIL